MNFVDVSFCAIYVIYRVMGVFNLFLFWYLCKRGSDSHGSLLFSFDII